MANFAGVKSQSPGSVALFLSLCLLPLFARAEEPTPRPALSDNEVTWSAWLAQEMDGIAEFRTVDGSRVDVLTDTHAWEVEWCKKQNQAQGQACQYAAMTGRKPGIILLARDKPNEEVYWLRCLLGCLQYGIPVIVIDCKTGRKL